MWEYGLFANFKPGKQETWVDYGNADRAPLLFIAGERGPHHAAVGEQVERQALEEEVPALTEYHEFAGRSPLDVRRAGLGGGRRHGPLTGHVEHASAHTSHAGLTP